MHVNSNYKLIIDATVSGGPVFALLDERSKPADHLNYTDFQEKYTRRESDNSSWESVHIIVPALDLQYFPAVAYDAHLKDSFSKYLLDDGVTPVSAMRLDDPAVVALYREKRFGSEDVLKQFPEADRVIFAPVYLAWLSSMNNHAEKSTLHIHQAADTVCMTVFNQGKFIFQREFQCATDDDFNYFLIRVLALSDQHASELAVSVSGDLVEGDSWYMHISKYCPHIQHVALSESYHIFYADHWRKI